MERLHFETSKSMEWCGHSCNLFLLLSMRWASTTTASKEEKAFCNPLAHRHRSKSLRKSKDATDESFLAQSFHWLSYRELKALMFELAVKQPKKKLERINELFASVLFGKDSISDILKKLLPCLIISSGLELTQKQVASQKEIAHIASCGNRFIDAMSVVMPFHKNYTQIVSKIFQCCLSSIRSVPESKSSFQSTEAHSISLSSLYPPHGGVKAQSVESCETSRSMAVSPVPGISSVPQQSQQQQSLIGTKRKRSEMGSESSEDVEHECPSGDAMSPLKKRRKVYVAIDPSMSPEAINTMASPKMIPDGLPSAFTPPHTPKLLELPPMEHKWSNDFPPLLCAWLLQTVAQRHPQSPKTSGDTIKKTESISNAVDWSLPLFHAFWNHWLVFIVTKANWYRRKNSVAVNANDIAYEETLFAEMKLMPVQHVNFFLRLLESGDNSLRVQFIHEGMSVLHMMTKMLTKEDWHALLNDDGKSVLLLRLLMLIMFKQINELETMSDFTRIKLNRSHFAVQEISNGDLHRFFPSPGYINNGTGKKIRGTASVSAVPPLSDDGIRLFSQHPNMSMEQLTTSIGVVCKSVNDLLKENIFWLSKKNNRKRMTRTAIWKKLLIECGQLICILPVPSQHESAMWPFHHRLFTPQEPLHIITLYNVLIRAFYQGLQVLI
ncbi:hypothetical protein RFI_30581 [Reticulomyxa filosa]|uniref:Uncharacterized protein n=1 Tax=Reticulomyxa filosa TaxID=46433 RepID=X6M1E6_RETFI|nr:hypothetical protein RFI_30581 [Reticulomyxa filosa]|eukprot:ETO06810.1 hypothetical protein RFI_30581 [Reticulomyxa filosa]